MFNRISLMVLFTVGNVLVCVGTSGLTTKYVVGQYDRSPAVETVVLRELPEPKVEPKAEAKKISVGELVMQNEQPVVPAGWKAGTPERIGRTVCTPAVGPGGEEVVVVEFDGDASFAAAEVELKDGMKAGGWKDEASGRGLWKSGKSATIERIWDRNRTTYVVAKGKDFSAAEDAAERFRLRK